MFTHRLVRKSFGINKTSGVDALIAFMNEIKQWGYNGIFVDASIVHKIRKVDPAKLQDFSRAVAEAKKLGIALIPMTEQQNSASIDSLMHAEAFYSKNTKFVVSSRIATVVGDPVTINNAGFEDFTSAMIPPDWKGPVPGMFQIDTVEKAEGKASLRMTNPSKRIYLSQSIDIKPNTTYRLKVKIKTENFEVPRELGFDVLSGNKWLLELREAKGVRVSQPWRDLVMSFNSLDKTRTKIMVCASGKPCTGKAWFDDIRIEEVGLFETVRRSTLPIVVASKANPGTIYKEGVDYVVGEEKLTIPSGSAIKDGDTLLVDWYKLASTVTRIPPASYCHDEAWDLTDANIKAIDALFDNPRGRLMKYGEWRVVGWDPACIANYPNTGDYLDAVANLTNYRYKAANSNRQVFLWNDTYDPYHNAKDGPHQIRGSPKTAGQGLDEEIIILNWNAGKRDSSMLFFAGRNPRFPNKKTMNRQIMSCGAFENGGVWGEWLAYLDSLEADGLPDGAVIGIHYHTYVATRYDKLDLMANVCKDAGRWLSGPIPFPEPGAKDPRPREVDAHPFSLDIGSRKDAISIRYSLPHNGRIAVRVHDVAGRLVSSHSQGKLGAGKGRLQIPRAGHSAGVYFVFLSFQSGNGLKRQTHKRAVLF